VPNNRQPLVQGRFEAALDMVETAINLLVGGGANYLNTNHRLGGSPRDLSGLLAKVWTALDLPLYDVIGDPNATADLHAVVAGIMHKIIHRAHPRNLLFCCMPDAPTSCATYCPTLPRPVRIELDHMLNLRFDKKPSGTKKIFNILTGLKAVSTNGLSAFLPHRNEAHNIKIAALKIEMAPLISHIGGNYLLAPFPNRNALVALKTV